MPCHFGLKSESKNHFMQELSSNAQQLFIESSQLVNLKKGERLDFSHYKNMLGIVHKGMLKMTCESKKQQQITLDILEKDNFFDTKRSLHYGNMFFIEAITASEVSFIPSYTFVEIMQHSPELTRAFFYQIFQKNFALYKLLMRQVFCDNKGKIASVLLQLSKYFGKQYGEYILIDFFITHHEIGSFIGTSRESVTKTMVELKKCKLISYLDKKIVILNYPQLLKCIFS